MISYKRPPLEAPCSHARHDQPVFYRRWPGFYRLENWAVAGHVH